MDNYPSHLAPEFSSDGAVLTPFADWWARVRSEFPSVPDDVAEQWLHRHWSHSPYSWLKSANYKFELEQILAANLIEIRNPDDKSIDDTLQIGRFRLTQRFWVRDYLVENRTFPVPIIALDNSDGHLDQDPSRPNWIRPMPKMLIEGHRRYEVAIGLWQEGGLPDTLPVWWMRRVGAK